MLRLKQLTFSTVRRGTYRMQDVYVGERYVGAIFVYPDIKQGKPHSTTVQSNLLMVPFRHCKSRKHAQSILRKAYRKMVNFFVYNA